MVWLTEHTEAVLRRHEDDVIVQQAVGRLEARVAAQEAAAVHEHEHRQPAGRGVDLQRGKWRR